MASQTKPELKYPVRYRHTGLELLSRIALMSDVFNSGRGGLAKGTSVGTVGTEGGVSIAS